MPKAIIYLKTKYADKNANLKYQTKKLYPLLMTADSLKLDVAYIHINDSNNLKDFSKFLKAVFPDIKSILLDEKDKKILGANRIVSLLELGLEVIVVSNINSHYVIKYDVDENNRTKDEVNNTS